MLALIDGDVLAHMCCKSRFSKGKMQEYTDIVSVVPDKKAVTFSKEEDRKYLEDSWENFQKRLDEVLDICFTDHYLMAVKSPINFRDELYPLEFNEDKTKAIWGYKANRWKPEGQSNKFVPTIRKLAIVNGFAIEAYGREADDLLRIWATQARAAGEEYIIVSIDKDLKCIPGKHLNIKSQEITTVTDFEATRFFYQQLLSGDQTDNIPGVPGLGPVKSEKLLYNTHTEEALQEIIVEMYMGAYEDNWYEMLLSNGKMLYLQGAENDHFKCSHWPVVEGLAPQKYSKAKKAVKPIEAVTVVSPVVKPPSPSVVKPPVVEPPVSKTSPSLLQKTPTVRPFTGSLFKGKI